MFYGYIVAIGCLIVSMLMVGTYGSYGIFLKPIASEFGWTRAITSGARSMAHFLYGFFCIITGRLTDKFGPRAVLIGCGLYLGIGYILMSQISSVWQLYVFYGLFIGIGISGADTPVLSTVARWFVKRRGTVTGFVKAGAGIGILTIPFLSQWLISNYGWRDAYVIIAIFCAIGVVSAALFLKRDPAQIGQLPDGATKVDTVASNISVHHFSLREVLSTQQFWLLSLVWISFSFCMQIVLVHTAAHATDIGISTTIAATVLSAVGGFSIIGRLSMGAVSDALGKKSTFIIAFSSMASSMVLIQFANEAWIFYLFALLYGVAHGAIFTLISPMTAELFGLGSLGAILGTILFIGTIGGSVSPFLAGYIFDITGSYQLAFLFCLVLSVVAIVLLLFLKPLDGNSPVK